MLKDIRQYAPRTIADGPVVCQRYANAKPRILWVLREANGDVCLDLCKFLNDKLLDYPRWYSTYGAVVKISYGLINCTATKDIGRLQARDVVDTIRDVAVVNVNKRGGERRVVWSKLATNAQEFTSFVERQITVLDPEIIIAAGTASLLPECFRKYSTSLQGCKIGAVRLDDKAKAWLVKCYHTGQTRFTHVVLYEKIRKALMDAGWPMRQRSENGK